MDLEEGDLEQSYSELSESKSEDKDEIFAHLDFEEQEAQKQFTTTKVWVKCNLMETGISLKVLVDCICQPVFHVFMLRSFCEQTTLK